MTFAGSIRIATFRVTLRLARPVWADAKQQAFPFQSLVPQLKTSLAAFPHWARESNTPMDFLRRVSHWKVLLLVFHHI